MTLPLKDLAKLNQLINRIQSGQFDANDVDGLLMKLRAYAGGKPIFLEVAHYVAHSDARDRGLAQQSITAFVDSIRMFREYISEERPIDVTTSFPAYLYRLFLSQARLVDEQKLKADYKMSRASLIKKIEATFSVDWKAGTATRRDNKGGAELYAALQFVTGFIHSKPAFHLRDFHKELKEVLQAQQVAFDEAAWAAQADHISLAVLTLISNTEFILDGGGRATCHLETEHHFRMLNGQRLLPTGAMSSEPTSFGPLMIHGTAEVSSGNVPPLRVAFPVIETDLDPLQHCDPSLFRQDQAPPEFGNCRVEIINLAPDMSLSATFKLVRTDSLVQ